MDAKKTVGGRYCYCPLKMSNGKYCETASDVNHIRSVVGQCLGKRCCRRNMSNPSCRSNSFPVQDGEILLKLCEEIPAGRFLS